MTSGNTLDFDGLRPESAGLTTEHSNWRLQLRQFVETHIQPNLDDWNRSGTFPDELYRSASKAGILGMGFPESLGGCLEDADLYHRIIFAEEFHRLGSGVVFADIATHWIGLPAVVGQKDEALNEEVVRPILAGEKKIAFAITEPGGGSDVSRLATHAEKVADHWVLSGEKTLISGAMRADYVLTAVRTGGPGMGGISMLLVDTSLPGVEREPVDGLKWYSASNGSIRFDQTPVPARYLIGTENQGFRGLVQQINIERFSGISAALALARVSVSDALGFAQQREVFGKRLIDHQAIRHKLLDLVRALRVAYAYLDQCVARFEQGENIVADLGMLKIQASTTLEHCAREAMHVMGGAAYQDGSRSERILRESRIFALAGGTEETLKDLAARQLKF
jgi:acyl-CoA dehydrogenase